MPKITKSFIDRVAIPKKRNSHWDDEIKGFGLRVSPAGRKTFVAMYRFKGRQHFIKLGTYPTLTPDEARRQARITLAKVAEDKNPALEKRRPPCPTLQVLIETYIERHCQKKCKSSTVDENRKILARHFKKLKSRTVDQISKKEMMDYHADLSDTPREANSAIVLWRSAFKWGENYFDGMETLADPSRGVSLYERKKRKRRLSDDEISRIGKAMEELVRLNNPGRISREAAQAIHFIMLTGLRNGECCTLLRTWVDLNHRVIKFPDSKTGAKDIVLSDAAIELLKSVPEVPDNAHVFPGRLKGKGFKDLGKPWRRICERAKVRDATIHDLRHTFASQVDERHKKEMADLLGHATLAMTDAYRHSDHARIVEAANIAGTRIERLLTDDNLSKTK